MKIISKINSKENISSFVNYSNIIVIGSRFSLRPATMFDLDEIKSLASNNFDCKIFVEVDKIFHQFETAELELFLNELNKINIDGVIYQDQAILNLHLKNEYKFELCYDPQTYLTSSNQIKFYESFGVDYFNLSREITSLEVKKILNNVNAKEQVWLHGFGLTQMLHSKRDLVQNYVDFELNVFENKLSIDREKLSLYDEERDQSYPLICYKDETFIMSPTSVNIFDELVKFNKYGLKNIVLDFTCQNDESSINILEKYYHAIQKLDDVESAKEYINVNSNEIQKIAKNGTSLGLLYKKTVYKI